MNARPLLLLGVLLLGAVGQDLFLSDLTESKVFPAPVLSGLDENVPEDMGWETFQRIFRKTYRLEDVKAKKIAFEDNRAFIKRHNAEADEGRHSFRVGVNSLSDLVSVEYKKHFLGFIPAKHKSSGVPFIPSNEPPPASVDWRSSGAVTPVKNQGSCGSCWSFSATGSLEGHYQIATGALRSLSEQQLIDCSRPEGNQGCSGGAMTEAFDYITVNKGIDGEDDYAYNGQDIEPCWTAAEKRILATLNKYTNVPSGKEDALVAATVLGPVSVAIEANQAAFQQYKSGVFNAACGTKLDHGVLVVGYTADAFIVKNSWGAGWGEKGYIRMKRGSNICGISNMASFPNVAKGSPVPLPPPTPGPRPSLPCNCSSSCAATCSKLGWRCCDGTGGNCACSPPDSCPQCNPHPPDGPYARCKDNSGCQAGAECVNINGIAGNICMPTCKGYGSTCPPPSDKELTAARPYCDACVNGGGAESPNACILVCNATALDRGYAQAECQAGSTCKPLSLDKDPCDNGAKWPADAHPCQATKTCGVCTFP